MNYKVYTKEEIKAKIQVNDKWLLCGLVSLYRKGQTIDERRASGSLSHNGRGFNAYDCDFLTKQAKKLILGEKLHPNDIGLIRHKMVKYSGQLEKLQRGNNIGSEV